KSRRGIREDAPQCRVPAGAETGRTLEGELDARKEVQCARGPGGTQRRPRVAVRAADVHEFQRRERGAAGAVFSGAAQPVAGGGGRRGYSIRGNPAAAWWRQRRASWA